MKKQLAWLSAVIITVLVFGTIYAAVQQSQRSDANDPQIQLAEDTATLLNNGTNPKSLKYDRINMASSLAPYVNIYTKNDRSIVGSGYLNGSIPIPPAGLLASSKGKDYSAITWQPQYNVRVASVAVAADNYYILSGRSLQKVEINENRTFDISALGCLVSLLVLSGTYLIVQKNR